MANLAVLKAEVTRPKHGFLQSDWPAKFPLTGWVYLWTATLPANETTLPQLQQKWDRWSKKRSRDLPGFAGVRCFEPSPVYRWHAHWITVNRFNVNGVRQHMQAYGFGRINVKRIPAAKAVYIAKYVTKSKRMPEAHGAQLLATFGFKAIKRSDLIVTDTWTDYVLRVTPQPDGQFTPWFQRHAKAVKIWQKSLDLSPGPGEAGAGD